MSAHPCMHFARVLGGRRESLVLPLAAAKWEGEGKVGQRTGGLLLRARLLQQPDRRRLQHLPRLADLRRRQIRHHFRGPKRGFTSDSFNPPNFSPMPRARASSAALPMPCRLPQPVACPHLGCLAQHFLALLSCQRLIPCMPILIANKQRAPAWWRGLGTRWTGP